MCNHYHRHQELQITCFPEYVFLIYFCILSEVSQEKASAEIRGEFIRTKSWVNFAGDFFGGFFRAFFLGKKREEKFYLKIHGKIQIRIWEFRDQNPHCKNQALKVSSFKHYFCISFWANLTDSRFPEPYFVISTQGSARKFRRVTIRAAQPSARSARKFASERALRGSLRGLCGVSPRVLRGLCGVLRDFPKFFPGAVTLCLWPSGTVGVLPEICAALLLPVVFLIKGTKQP